jgi:hypothetical protein
VAVERSAGRAGAIDCAGAVPIALVHATRRARRLVSSPRAFAIDESTIQLSGQKLVAGGQESGQHCCRSLIDRVQRSLFVVPIFTVRDR